MLKQMFNSKETSAADSARFILIFALCLFSFVQTNQAQTTAFTYQGKLTDSAAAANGQYDFLFTVWGSDTGGLPVSGDILLENVQVTSGIFTVNLDFGTAPFDSLTDNHLEIKVRPGVSVGAFTVLSPRQRITSSPYSIKTLKANSADSLSSMCALCVTDGQILTIDGAKVTGTVNNAVTAANVSGIVPLTNGGTGSTTKNFADLTTNQTIGGRKIFTDPISGDGSLLTNVSATVANGSITTAKLADASVTAAKLAPDAIAAPVSNLNLLGSLRWDLLRGQKDFAAGTTPRAVAFDGANMWVTNVGGSVVKLRVSDGANLGTFPAGTNPYGIAFDGANMWIVNLLTPGSIVKLRMSDGANLGSFPVGANPAEIAFDGANMWVSNGGSNNVIKLRASDGANLGTFPVGGAPSEIAFDGANMWVSNNSGNVTRLSPAFP